MKRSGIKRGTKPMKRTQMKRGARIKAVNSKRRRQRWAKHFLSEEFVAFTKACPCSVCGERGPSEVAHTRSRGAGGDWTQTVPLCCRCHTAQHQMGVETFQIATTCNLTKLAREHHERWCAHIMREAA